MIDSISVPLKKATINDKQISQAWDKLTDKWNGRYKEYGDINRKYLIDPTIFRLTGSVKGSSILDVDLSKRFIEIAQRMEKRNYLGIVYHIGTLSTFNASN